MKLTTDAQERWENFKDWFWQIAGGACLFVICFWFYIMSWAMSLPKVGP